MVIKRTALRADRKTQSVSLPEQSEILNIRDEFPGGFWLYYVVIDETAPRERWIEKCSETGSLEAKHTREYICTTQAWNADKDVWQVHHWFECLTKGFVK